MTPFKTIRARAEKREGGAEALARLLPEKPAPIRFGASALFEGPDARPVLVRSALRTAFPLPERVSPLAKALMLRLMPEVLGPAAWTTRLLPERVSALPNDLIKTFLSLSQYTMRVSERS